MLRAVTGSGATAGAAAGVAASGDQTEGWSREEEREKWRAGQQRGDHLFSCTSSLMMLPVKWRMGDVCWSYLLPTLIHHKDC